MAPELNQVDPHPQSAVHAFSDFLGYLFNVVVRGLVGNARPLDQYGFGFAIAPLHIM